jgi:uncharacterized membrane protein
MNNPFLKRIMEALNGKNNPKKIVPTIILYVIAFISFLVFSKTSPNGPCNPGLGLIIFLFIGVFALLLLVVNIYKLIKYGKQYLTKVLIHLIALIITAILGAV